MVLSVSAELDVTTDLSARVRTANWELVRTVVAGLGDGWDLEDATFELLCECGRVGCQSSVSISLVDYVEARSKGYDVVARCHEDPLDLVVVRTDDYKVVARAANRNGNVDLGGTAVGNWRCTCGQGYRVAARGSHLILWPRNSATGFRREPIGDRCVNGCTVDRLNVLHEVMATPLVA
jgi:hypothetical protein